DLNVVSFAGGSISGATAATFRQPAPATRLHTGVLCRTAAVGLDAALTQPDVGATPVAGLRHRRAADDRSGVFWNWLRQRKRRLFAAGTPATAECRNACDFAGERNVYRGAVRDDHGRHGRRNHPLHHGWLDSHSF